MAFAYICSGCEHPMTGHVKRVEASERLYECQGCGCTITADGPCYTVTKAQFVAAFPKHPASVRA